MDLGMTSQNTGHTNLVPEVAVALLEFMHIAERLKDELRHSFTSKGRHESVAEHSWRLVLLALLMKPYLPDRLKWERLLEMLIIHDIAEAHVGDVPIFEANGAQRAEAERAAIQAFHNLLPAPIGVRIQELCEEFEMCNTLESQIANALDKLEAQIQHNEASLSTWLDWEKRHVFAGFAKVGLCDRSISTMTEAIIEEARNKLNSGH